MKITLVGARYCIPCQAVKRALTDKLFDFEYLDITNDAEAEKASALGCRPGIPQVIVELPHGKLYLGPDLPSILRGLRQLD